MREITIPTSALVTLFDYLPNPDDPDPVGPGGPVIRGLDWVLLNPQPLPPREVLVSRVVRQFRTEWGPRPEPWVWASVTRAVITAHLHRFTMAGIIIVRGDTEHPVRVITESLSTVIDELCGTPPHKGPFPAPWGPLLDTDALHPVNLVIAGIQFQKTADALQDHPLHDDPGQRRGPTARRGLQPAGITERAVDIGCPAGTDRSSRNPAGRGGNHSTVHPPGSPAPWSEPPGARPITGSPLA